jgi:deltex-like protein
MSSSAAPRRSRRRQAAAAAAPEVVDLLSSSSEDETMDVVRTKPAARTRRRVATAKPQAGNMTYNALSVEDAQKKPAARTCRTRRIATAKPQAGNMTTNVLSAEDTQKKPAAACASQPQQNMVSNIVSLLSDGDTDDDDLHGGRNNKTNDRRRRATAVRGRAGASDAELASWFQQQEDVNFQQDQEFRDASFAASLHAEEEQAKNKRKRKEMADMKSSTAGKAVLLADKVIQLVELLQDGGIEPVGKDDAVYLAEKMLARQEEFKQAGVPTHVSIGYHYTHQQNLEIIRTDGLLTVEDRKATNNKNTRNIAVFGNGIYTATNPHAFTQYGGVGLLVAVLRGKEQTDGNRGNPELEKDINAVIGNKTGMAAPYFDEIILKSSAQVLPLIKFPQRKIQQKSFSDHLWKLHEQIQHEVLDECFNDSTRTVLVRISMAPAGAAGTNPVAMAATGFSFLSTRVPGAAIPGLASLTGALTGMPLPPMAPAVAAGTNPVAMAATGFPFVGMNPGMPTSIASLWAGANPSFAFLNGAPPAGTHLQAVASGVASCVAAASLPMAPAPLPSSQPSRRNSPSRTTTVPETIVYKVPTKLAGPSDTALQPVVGSGGKCSICICALESTDPNIVKLQKCNHEFHRACIESSLKHSVKCPDCRVLITGKLQGTSPSGSMSILANPSVDVSGFPGEGSISVCYNMKGGVQKAFHQNPGVSYVETTRTAYLPDNSQGRELLKRLKYAFQHGLMFSISASLTTMQTNMIVWSGIHVKTSPHGGAHGWPDPNYFQNANSELDGRGVPPAWQI